MTSDNGRYEIRETKISDAVAAQFPEMAEEKIFTVWNRETDKPVPFGRFRSRASAQAWADWLTRKEGGLDGPAD